MWREARDAVLDMLQACDEVLAFAEGSDLASLEVDTMRLRAMERSLAILGEAAKRVDASLRERYPSIPWREMAGLRDVLVHDYFVIDVDVIAQLVRAELPALRLQLASLIDTEGWTAP